MIPQRCSGLLLRHLFYQYARQILPQLSDMLDVYGTLKWYQLHYGMDKHGRLQQGAATSDDTDNGHDKDKDGCQTRFEIKRKLKVFMDILSRERTRKRLQARHGTHRQPPTWI